jgi:hypothetical protein
MACSTFINWRAAGHDSGGEWPLQQNGQAYSLHAAA